MTYVMRRRHKAMDNGIKKVITRWEALGSIKDGDHILEIVCDTAIDYDLDMDYLTDGVCNKNLIIDNIVSSMTLIQSA